MSPELAIEHLRNIAANQDQAAFASVFKHYAPLIKGYMMRHGADAAAAEELAQESLLSVWRKAHMYSSDKGNPTTWIFAIARNLRIDRIRRERVWQPLPEDYTEQASEEDPADEILSRAEQIKAMRDAIAGLPSEQLEVVTLSYMDGLSHGEVASRLNLPLGTVKSRMRLAYDKLRPVLHDVR